MMSRFQCDSKRAPAPLVFRGGNRGRFHFRNFAEQVRFCGDSFQMRISFATVVINLVSPKEIFILNK